MNVPDWVAAEMPPGYQNRLLEIQRLTDELRRMDPFGRLLWESGASLVEPVRDAFRALALDVEPLAGAGAADFSVKLDGGRRLLVHVSESEQPIRRKDAELAQLFHLLHEIAGDGDRVVLVANAQGHVKPADRAEAIDPEALKLISRMGANYLPAITLFKLWKLSLDERNRARDYMRWLHEQDGGLFVPAIV